MKEHITLEQISEVNEIQFHRLFKNSKPEKRDDWQSYYYKDITLSRLIEFLSPLRMQQFSVTKRWNAELFGHNLKYVGLTTSYAAGDELIDVLWELAKEILKCQYGRI